MREVSKKDFYGPIYEKGLNVHPHIQSGQFPYTTIWKYLGTLQGKKYGMVVDRDISGEIVSAYFLND